MADDPEHISGMDASGGEKRGGQMRLILGLSLALIVIAFAALFIYYR